MTPSELKIDQLYEVVREGFMIQYVGADGFNELPIGAKIQCTDTKGSGQFKVDFVRPKLFIAIGTEPYVLERLKEYNLSKR